MAGAAGGPFRALLRSRRMTTESKSVTSDDNSTRPHPVSWIAAVVVLTVSYYLLRLDIGGLPVDVIGSLAGVLTLGWLDCSTGGSAASLAGHPLIFPCVACWPGLRSFCRWLQRGRETDIARGAASRMTMKQPSQG
jgi:hypothetical protein